MKNRFSLLLVLQFIFITLSVNASIWYDPSFEKLLSESDLITVVEVVEGGEFEAKVKAIRTLKGVQPKKPFKVNGFNNQNWPADAIEEQAFKKGQKFLLFLYGGSPPENDDKPLIFTIPTPSTGDYPIINGKLHGGWFRTSYPHSEPGVPLELSLSLIKAALPNTDPADVKHGRKQLTKFLTADFIKSIPMESDDEKEDAEIYKKSHLAEWLLFAQGAFGEKNSADAVFEASKSQNILVQISAGRALKSIPASPRSLEALKRLLLIPETFVQAEATRTLIQAMSQQPPGYQREEVIKVIHSALETSRPEDGRSRRIMNPIRNQYASGRELMITALDILNSKESQKELIKLLRSKDLYEGVFIALSKYFLKYPSKEARAKIHELYLKAPERILYLFHEHYLYKERSPETIEVICKKLVSIEEFYYSADEVLLKLSQITDASSRLKEVVYQLIKKHHKSDDVYFLLDSCFLFPSERTLKLLNSMSSKVLDDEGQEELKYVKSAIALKLNPPAEKKELIAEILNLIKVTADKSTLFYRLLDFLVEITPEDSKLTTCESLRKIYIESEKLMIFDTIERLGGKLSKEEKEKLETYKEYAG